MLRPILNRILDSQQFTQHLQAFVSAYNTRHECAIALDARDVRTVSLIMSTIIRNRFLPLDDVSLILLFREIIGAIAFPMFAVINELLPPQTPADSHRFVIVTDYLTALLEESFEHTITISPIERQLKIKHGRRYASDPNVALSILDDFDIYVDEYRYLDQNWRRPIS